MLVFGACIVISRQRQADRLMFTPFSFGGAYLEYSEPVANRMRRKDLLLRGHNYWY